MFLIVDDDSLTVEMIVLSAKSRGFDAVAAGSVDEADEMLREHEIDVILTDVDLRGPRTGISAAAQWTENYPDALVIVMSGHNLEMISDLDEMPDSGRFIQKPFTFDQIESLLSTD